MGSSVKRVEAIMTSTGGDEYPVRLSLELHDSETGRETISKMTLASDFVPDGEYVLEFVLGKPCHEHVRVQNGSLISR